MLRVEQLNQYYGGSHILRDVGFEAKVGEVTVVLGRNGVGKTTLLKCLMGVERARAGKITFDGHDITQAAPHVRARLGIGYVPQGREIFPRLSVEENLLTGLNGQKTQTISSDVYEMFPVLKEMRRRRGGDLSGGQQQQLAIGRALLTKPKLLILDEPTEGIQPSIIKDIAKTLNRLKTERNFSMVVSEQVLWFTQEIADRFLIIEKGEFVYEDVKARVDTAKIHAFLTV